MSQTSKQDSSKKPDPGERKGPAPDPELQNEGEGSRSGARRYDAGAERAASNPAHVEEAAKKAKQALEGAEGEELRRAEERGKKGQHR
jgi:hypothetical protein